MLARTHRTNTIHLCVHVYVYVYSVCVYIHLIMCICRTFFLFRHILFAYAATERVFCFKTMKQNTQKVSLFE